ncbi:hypothetical protein E8P77_01205 [Soehngenia saccharolytica]|nr:hypothetical protein E8P77_01205 [Soehngenia saccharolytica]
MVSNYNNIDIRNLNLFINNEIKNNNVNNLALIAVRDLDDDLSVILEPNLAYKDVYHGLHPKFNVETLKKFISDLKNNDYNSFKAEIKQRNKEFNYMNLIIDEDYHDVFFTKIFNSIEFNNIDERESLEEALLGKCILQMSTHYGYIVNTRNNESMYNYVISFLILKNIEETIYWSRNDKDLQINIFNIWPEDYIKILSGEFSFVVENNSLFIEKASNCFDNKLIMDFLKHDGEIWEKYYKLIDTDTYYSGVMPCVKSINYDISQIHSLPTKILTFKVVRTTYATVDAFDNSLINKHEFLKGTEYGSLINSFDTYEDKIQDSILHNDILDLIEFSNNFDYEKKHIHIINEYLKTSLNTHTIAVSSNLVTTDDYLIVAIRGNKSIDSGEIYCSVNGQSEFVDENVPFYRQSVYEDLPTMDYFSKTRVDLNYEIQRECIAELGITSFNYGWKYNGVSYLSINNRSDLYMDINSKSKNNGPNDNNYPYVKRRMHFNVLLNNRVPYTFFEVKKAYKTATECFENKSLIGIKINIHESKIKYLLQKSINLYNFIRKNKSEILILGVFISLILGKTNKNNLGNNFYFDLVIFILYIIILINDNVRSFKTKRNTLYEKNVFLFNTNNSIIKYRKILNKIKKINDNFKFNGIFLVLFYWYIKDLSNDNQ